MARDNLNTNRGLTDPLDQEEEWYEAQKLSNTKGSAPTVGTASRLTQSKMKSKISSKSSSHSTTSKRQSFKIVSIKASSKDAKSKKSTIPGNPPNDNRKSNKSTIPPKEPKTASKISKLPKVADVVKT